MKKNFSEDEWLAYTGDPWDMICYVKDRISSRKLRLFYCACVRRVSELLVDERSRKALEASERFADGLLDVPQLVSARIAANQANYEICTRLGHDVPIAEAAAAAFICANTDLAFAAGVPATIGLALKDMTNEHKIHASLFRDIVGNPFRPIGHKQLAGGSADHMVLELANDIYDRRDFKLMPSLGTALKDAHCHEEEILSHCRQGDMHVRGCWLLDLVIGKE
jgi:hypothetical protein